MVDDIENPDEEPSIEDILSSIRDIISDDDEEDGGEGAAASADDVPDLPGVSDAPVAEDTAEEPESEEAVKEESNDDDVLDLTDVVDDNDTKNVPEEDKMADSENLPVDDIDALFDTPAADDADDNDPLAGINLDHPDEGGLDITDTVPAVEAEEVSENGVEDILSEVAVEDVPATPATEETPETPEGSILNDAAATATVSSMARLAENIAVSRTTEGTTLEDITRDLLRPMLKIWLDENLPTVIERLVAQELERLAEKAARK
ncbi:MAG: hypothetical protein COB76_00100 [Alphaproteobacteria bacterium]|nr:MAG: hypothetical protein COB76_00100 [Alphaproteobacteria bacterium]